MMQHTLWLQSKRLLLLSLFLFDSVRLAVQFDIREYNPQCTDFWDLSKKGTLEECERLDGQKLKNLFLLSSAYCFNDGTGLCKGISGRFEFLFNVFQDKVIGPVEPSEFVDNYGYHKRIPQAYNVKGKIVYHDRSINWAKLFKKSLANRKISLLSTTDFNWCAYVEEDWWPYKSAIKDYKSNGKYQIYFFNRQSCVVNTQTNQTQHFNTRFLHNSSLRIDLDMNPTIFAMEDNLAKEIRLVKHKRQHWYEVKYQVIENPTPSITYFVSMAATQSEPCIITGVDGRHILSRRAYRNFTNLCLSDSLFKREGKNSELLAGFCGYDVCEVADYPYPIYSDPARTTFVYEVNIHNIPRHPRSVESFYGVTVADDEDWITFAKDGFVFSATTSIPIANSKNKVRVISLYAEYKKAVDKYDEYYPMPYLSDYIATYKNEPEGYDWDVSDRAKKARSVTNLNYVDDIAYLHKCKTILVIFGPLYSEVPAENFSVSNKGPVDSIYELGMWELTSAFFAMPDGSSIFWAYHRMNYIADYKYTCSKGPNELVTAVRASSRYYIRASKSPPPKLWSTKVSNPIDTVDETFMKLVGVYKGNYEPREPPNPRNYPIGNDTAPLPTDRDTTWIYIVIGIGILLIVAMCIICLMTFRRRRKRRHQAAGSSLTPTRRSSMASGKSSRVPSARSGMSAHSGLSHKPTKRSSMGAKGLHSSPKTSRSTMRSGLSPRSSGSRSSRASGAKTARSSMRGGSSPRSSSSQGSRASGASGPKTARSSMRGGSSPHSSNSQGSRTSGAKTSRSRGH